MNYTDRIATLADIILDSARILLDPGNASAQGRSAARARAHAKLTQSLTAMVSMAQATEAYALAIEESALGAESDAEELCQNEAAHVGSLDGRSSSTTSSVSAEPSGSRKTPSVQEAAAGEPNYAKYS